jgi:hypothetical protein
MPGCRFEMTASGVGELTTTGSQLLPERQSTGDSLYTYCVGKEKKALREVICMLAALRR